MQLFVSFYPNDFFNIQLCEFISLQHSKCYSNTHTAVRHVNEQVRNALYIKDVRNTNHPPPPPPHTHLYIIHSKCCQFSCIVFVPVGQPSSILQCKFCTIETNWISQVGHTHPLLLVWLAMWRVRCDVMRLNDDWHIRESIHRGLQNGNEWNSCKEYCILHAIYIGCVTTSTAQSSFEWVGMEVLLATFCILSASG